MSIMLRHYAIVFLGCLIASASINMFLVPSHLLSGGISGIAMLVYYMFDLPIGFQMFIYNLPLFYAAYKALSKQYLIDAVSGTVLLSVCLDLTRFLSGYSAANDPMLAAVYGGVFSGIGYGIIFRVHGSAGGLDIVAAIVKKYYSFHMGGVKFAMNCIIMAIAAVLFGALPAMYTLISMYICGIVTDKIVAGFNHRKVLMIISDRVNEIADGIIHEIGRGVTFLEAEGGFTHQKRKVLFVVATLTQIARLKMITDIFDKNAFMIVMDANEVMGRGFTLPGEKVAEILKERDAAKNKNASLEQNTGSKENL